jgi:hypothetical protein
MDGTRTFNAKFAGHECRLAQRPASRQRHHNMINLRAVGFLSKYGNTWDTSDGRTLLEAIQSRSLDQQIWE